MNETAILSRPTTVVVVDPNDISRRALGTVLDGDLRIIGGARSVAELDLDEAREADVALLGETRHAGAAIAAIRRAAPWVKVVAMVHEGDGEGIYQSIQNGAAGILPLSSGPDEIRAAIDEVVATGTAVDVDLALEALRWAADREEVPVAPAEPPRLTAREAEVLEQLGTGRTAAAIAASLGLSRRTVEAHLANAYRKLGVHSRFEALARMRGSVHQAHA